MNTHRNVFALALVALLSSLAAATEPLSLGSPFTDHAVLQRDMAVPVWGKAEPGSEVSVEFAFSGTDAGGYPQVHARVQSDTVAQSDKLDSYLLYVEDEFVAQLSRERDSEILTDLQTLSLTQTLTVGPTYRLRMRVVGAHPVQVTGYVEVKNAAGWSTIGFASTVDDDVTQLADAGSVGMSASNGDVSFAYDNFSRTNL